MRPYAVELIFFSYDNEKGSLLYKIDPAGHYTGYFATSSGLKEEEAQHQLEKLYRNQSFSQLNKKQVIESALKSLQETIGQDFK